MAKHSINLLQVELLPKQALWTLNRVALVWGASFVIMMLWLIITQVLLSFSLSEQQDLQRVNNRSKAELEQLEVAIKNHKPDAKLEYRLETLKLAMANKAFLQKQLTDTTRTYVTGFSTAMTELAEFHHKDISLHSVSINTDEIVLGGVARKPNVVPSWLARFEKSQFLAGKRFVNFSLNENDNKYIEFSVRSENIEEVK